MKLEKTIQAIIDLGLTALAQHADEQKKYAARIMQFKLIKDEPMPKKKMPPNVRQYRNGSFQARKTVKGVSYVAYGKTPQEAYGRLQKAIHAPQTFTKKPAADPHNLTFGAFIDLWYTTYKAPKLAESSLYQIRNVCDKHIPQWLKDIKLSELTSVMVQKALNGIASDRMREYAYTVYSDCLGWAYDLEYIPKDVMRTVPAVRSERKRGKAMSLADQEIFLALVAKLPDPLLRRQFRFYLLSGARPGELKAMTAADFQKDLGRIFIPGTKNKYSERFIPYFAEIDALLAEIPLQTGSPVFPYNARQIAKLMRSLFPAYTPKDLRHTFATRCKECGIPTDVYKQWLGHSKGSKVAETTYTHYENVNKIEAQKFSLIPPYLDPKL